MKYAFILYFRFICFTLQFYCVILWSLSIHTLLCYFRSITDALPSYKYYRQILLSTYFIKLNYMKTNCVQS